MSGPRTYPEGVTSWVDIECRDVAAAMAFYGGLFGWTYVDAAPPGARARYVVARLDGLDAAGIGERVGSGAASAQPGSWNTYVAVDDAEATCARVEAAGGRVLTPPSQADARGRSAVCADAAGALFRLWQAGELAGAQAVNRPGGWNFSNLLTADADAAARFYAEVFGWVVADVGFGKMIRVPGYGDHLAATSDPDIHTRQAEIAAPPGFADATGWIAPLTADESARWHVVFTVADRDTSAAEAERLGGNVLGRSDSDWTRDALIRDPQGGVFTASQFTPPG